MIHKRRSLVLLLPLLSLLAGAGCDDDDVAGLDPAAAVFEVRVAEQENFRFAVTNPQAIAEAEARMASGVSGVISGELARGDGAHNAPYSWHLVDATIHFPDQAIEACSGRPMSDVEADLDYWVDNLGQYCPWGAVIVKRVR